MRKKVWPAINWMHWMKELSNKVKNFWSYLSSWRGLFSSSIKCQLNLIYWHVKREIYMNGSKIDWVNDYEGLKKLGLLPGTNLLICCMDIHSQVSETDRSRQHSSEMKEINTKKATKDVDSIENSERKRNIQSLRWPRGNARRRERRSVTNWRIEETRLIPWNKYFNVLHGCL